MTCTYPDCGEPAAFHCVSEEGGARDAHDLCEKHKRHAETIAAIFGFPLTVTPIQTDN